MSSLIAASEAVFDEAGFVDAQPASRVRPKKPAAAAAAHVHFIRTTVQPRPAGDQGTCLVPGTGRVGNEPFPGTGALAFGRR